MCTPCCKWSAKVSPCYAILIAFLLEAIFITVIINVCVQLKNPFEWAAFIIPAAGGLLQSIFFGLYTDAVAQVEKEREANKKRNDPDDEEQQYSAILPRQGNRSQTN